MPFYSIKHLNHIIDYLQKEVDTCRESALFSLKEYNYHNYNLLRNFSAEAQDILNYVISYRNEILGD